MTTCVLHGGASSKEDSKNDAFFAQFTRLVDKNSVKILMCYWAREAGRWEELLERDSKKILAQADKNVEFTLLNNPNDLGSQIQVHDALYVAGGDVADMFEEHLPQLKNLKQYLDGKIYIGCSVGAYLASTYYARTADALTAEFAYAGLGLVPFGVMCHWDVDELRDSKVQLIKKSDREIPILTLNECESVKIVV